MPLFLGPGDGAIVTAVVGLGGVGIVKIKYVPRRGLSNLSATALILFGLEPKYNSQCVTINLVLSATVPAHNPYLCAHTSLGYLCAHTHLSATKYAHMRLSHSRLQ